MSIFQKIRSSRQDLSCKKNFLKIKLLQNSWKIIRDVVFNLKNLGLKVGDFIEKRVGHMHFPKNFVDVLRTPIL